jgi:hypothetical protein
MNSNGLDRLFRNGLDSGGPVPFDPEHWEGARILLESDKAKRKRDRLWFLLLILVVGLMNAGLVYFSNSGIQEMEALPVPQETYERAMAGNTPPKIVPLEIETEIKESLSHLTSKDSSSFEKNQNKTKRSGQALGLVEPNKKVPAETVYAQVNTNETGMESDKGIASGQEVRTPGYQIPILEEPEGMEGNPVFVNALESRKMHLEMPVRDEHPGLQGPLFKKHTKPITRFGWTAALLVQPTMQGTAPVQGVEFGFAAEYFFKKKWFAGVAPQAQWRINETGFSKFQELTTFSFSSENQIFGLKANSLQVVNVPFYVGWTNNKNILEAGATVNWLISARGQLQQIDIEGTEVSPLNKFSNGWIETSDMKKLTSSLFTSYKFKINQRMYTGFRIHYQLGRWYPGLPNRLDQSTTRRFTLAWQGIYYIK